MKKLLLFAVIAATVTLSGCAFSKDFAKSTDVKVDVPKDNYSPLVVTAKFWSMAELAKKYTPKKFEDFVIETEKYCTFKIVDIPKDGNDTLTLQLKCDTAAGKIAGLFKKK